MSILFSIFNTIFLSVIELIYSLGMIIAMGFLLGVLERYSNAFLVKTFGPKGVLLTAWVGTPIHEIGHFLMCLVWGHRVTRVRLLQLHSPDGVLGFVEHQYNRNSIFQQVGNFFIGIGPLFSGIGSLILGMYVLIPRAFDTLKIQLQQHVSFEKLNLNVLETIVGAVGAVCKSIFSLHNVISPTFWIFILLAISISSHIALSTADIKNSAKGLQMIFFLLVLFNIAAGLLKLNSYQLIVRLTEYNAYVLAFSCIALIFSLFTLIVSFLLYRLKKQ